MVNKLGNLFLLTMLLGTLGCAVGPSEPAASGARIVLAQSDASRITTPSVSQEDQTALIAGNQAFALDLYRTWRRL